MMMLNQEAITATAVGQTVTSNRDRVLRNGRCHGPQSPRNPGCPSAFVFDFGKWRDGRGPRSCRIDPVQPSAFLPERGSGEGPYRHLSQGDAGQRWHIALEAAGPLCLFASGPVRTALEKRWSRKRGFACPSSDLIFFARPCCRLWAWRRWWCFGQFLNKECKRADILVLAGLLKT